MNNINTALAILNVSGIKPTEFGLELLHKISAKELTYDEAVALLRDKYMKIKEEHEQKNSMGF